MDDVLRHGSLPVPNHLRSATWREKRDFGTGKGYVYPHDYMGADVEQQYLPDQLAGRRYYEPSDHGYEKVIGERMANRQVVRDQASDAGGPERGSHRSPKVGRHEGRRQRHGHPRRAQALDRDAPEARGLIEGERDHPHDDEQQPEEDERSEQRPGNHEDPAHVERDVDVLGCRLGGEQAVPA